jgi:hypothetical protein
MEPNWLHLHFRHDRQNWQSSNDHPFCCKLLCRFCHQSFQLQELTQTHRAPMLCSWLSCRVLPSKSSFASLRSDLCATLWLSYHSRRRRQQIQTWDEPTRLARRDPSVLEKFERYLVSRQLLESWIRVIHYYRMIQFVCRNDRTKCLVCSLRVRNWVCKRW